jgi:DNA-binding transcriptional MerR regulator
MNNNNKTYKTIGEVAKILNLIDTKTGKLSTHTIRFWTKEFKQIKPHTFTGNRRYFNNKSIKILKKIHYLLKYKGMTIKGVKRLLDTTNSHLDDEKNKTIKSNIIRSKINKISKLVKNIKNYG